MRNPLYDNDLLGWTEQQASALRRRPDNEVDRENVAEEIEGLEISQVRSRALRRMPDTIDGVVPLLVPPECPFTLAELLVDPEEGQAS